MKWLLGTKEYTTQIFLDDGSVAPVTAVAAGPIIATQVKDKKKDGYDAVQFGFGVRAEKNINQAQKGHAQKLGNFKVFREIRDADTNGVKIGDTFNVSVFAEGDTVSVSGLTKGKGFQGVVKRHGFAGGQRTHGQKHSEREPGSIGGGGRAGGRVAKNMRMAGRMGGSRVTTKNLTIVKIDPTDNILYIKGALPGRKGTLLEIKG